MNSLEKKLSKLDAGLFAKFEEAKSQIKLLLGKYSTNFPSYTDHSADHTLEVFKIAAELVIDDELEMLNADEIYILSMACLLHDVGMCIPEEKISEILQSQDLIEYKKSHPNLSNEEAIRDIHHQLSRKFILAEWEYLNIPSIKYAKAIGLVAEGHRKVDLGNFEIYEPTHFIKSGKEFVCLPYLSCILRIADELDVTNSRTPKLLTKYYMPNNEVSVREWLKHMATSQRNYLGDQIIFEVECSDQNIYAALQDQFEKIQKVINICQKVIRAIPFIKNKQYKFSYGLVKVNYKFIGFDPKGIKFSFDVQNVVTAFIGEDLYKDRMTSLREAVQNAIDSCRYKINVLREIYSPELSITLSPEFIRIEDNGAGMDDFIIENFFGRLASSFYEQDKVKTQFEAIGQFGVGVFSYFLLSEFIDIETKTSQSRALKFRFDKDPKSYFHFYDSTVREEAGTTITMYIKKDLLSEITFPKIESYIKKVFKHIEIPISICDESNKSVIEFAEFKLDSKFEIKERLKLQNKGIENDLRLVIEQIKDEELEGMCGLIVGKNYLDTFKYSNGYFDGDQFRTVDHGHPLSQISVSQKGVFVNQYNSGSINLLIGDINLSRKIKINIDRNEFTDESQIHRIIQKFEFKILSNLFTEINSNCKSEIEVLQISDNFLNYYFNVYSSEFRPEYINLILDFIRIRNRDTGEIYKLSDLSSTFSDFVLTSDEEEDLPEKLNRNSFVANESEYTGYFSRISMIITKFLNYQDYVIQEDARFYKAFTLKPFNDTYSSDIERLQILSNRGYIKFTPVDSKKLVVHIWRNKGEAISPYYEDEDIYFNYNHHFIQYILHNFNKISTSPEHRKILKSVFEYLYELMQYDIQKITIQKLNDIINPLNSTGKIKKFTRADF